MSGTEGDCGWCGRWDRRRYYVILLNGAIAWVCSSCEKAICNQRALRANEVLRKAAPR